jgi:pantoate--beta-alanine ligase
MEILRTIKELKQYIKISKQAGKTIGFVPTMGYLHKGHLSLVEQSKKTTDITVVSIFVNSLQFGENEDLDKYPRDEQKDLEVLSNLDVDVVFIPDSKELYPEGFCSYVNVEGLSEVLCGASRSGHFRGVCTVVFKLLNLVEPDILFLGQKDAQQAVIIKRMIKDLDLQADVVVMPIIREENGLAMSSRNSYFSLEQKQKACIIYKSLCKAKDLIEQGVINSSEIKQEIVNILNQVKELKIDYVEIVNLNQLKPVEVIENNGILIAVAVFLGKIRLIDNIILRSSF